jgi:hypothetical protein
VRQTVVNFQLLFTKDLTYYENDQGKHSNHNENTNAHSGFKYAFDYGAACK